MSINNICFKKIRKNIAQVSLNNPFMKYFAGLLLGVPLKVDISLNVCFSNNFEKSKLTVW